MKILLTNYLLDSYGGTQSWIYTVGKELFNRGHDITIYSPHLSNFAFDYLNFAKITNQVPDEEYNLILCNHMMNEIKEVKGFKINLCHSFFLELEDFVQGADSYISISNEIKDIQKEKGFESKVIMNPIDFNRFYECPPTKLKRVLHFSKESSLASKVIEEACGELGLEFSIVQEPKFETEDIIKDFDLVIGIGRCLLESMAMGKNVISGDQRSWMNEFKGGGMVTPENFDDLKYSNWSGRHNPIIFDKEKVKEEIKKFSLKNNFRERLKKVCDHKLIVDKLLWIYTKNAI